MLWGIAAPVAAAPDAAKAMAFIRQGIARTVELLRSKQMPRQEIEQRLREELRFGFDVPEIASFALGPRRHGMTRDQERRFLHEFENFIVQTYTQRVFSIQPRVSNIATDVLEVTGTSPAGPDQIVVRSRINQKGARWVDIAWRLREHEDRLRIIDIIIVGISQSQVYRSEFASVARRNGGIEGLIDAMRRKNEELRGQ